MAPDKAIAKAKANRIMRDSLLEVVTGVNIDKLVAAKRRATAKAASRDAASAQAVLPPPWAFPPPILPQSEWPIHTPNLHPYPILYPVSIPPPPPPPPPPSPSPPPPKLESPRTCAIQPNPMNSTPQRPYVIPIANDSELELSATLPAQIIFVACHHCSICGKPRSAGYHRDNPLIPGQVAVSEPCGRCLKAGRDQTATHIVKVIETSSERRRARSTQRERTGTRVAIHERCRSPNRSRGQSRCRSLRQMSPQSHCEKDIEYGHLSKRVGTEVRKRSIERFEKTYQIHGAPAREEYWKYRHELGTATNSPLPKQLRKNGYLAHQLGETWSHGKETKEAVSPLQPPHEELLLVPIWEERNSYRHQRSEHHSTYSESIRKRHVNAPLEIEEDRPQRGQRIGCSSSRRKPSEIDESESDKWFSIAGYRDREVTSHCKASKSDEACKEEENKPILSHVLHIPSHGMWKDTDELDYKKSRVLVRYISSQRKSSDAEKPGEREQKRLVASQSGSVHSHHKDAIREQEHDGQETEEDGKLVISRFRYVDSRNELHKTPQFNQTEATHVGEVLGSFRYVAARNTSKELAASKKPLSTDSQTHIPLVRNYEIRHDAPHDTSSKGHSREWRKAEGQLQADLPRRGQTKVRFVSPVPGSSFSPNREAFRSNDYFHSHPCNPQSGEPNDKHAEEDSKAQEWNEDFRGDHIDPPTSDQRKGKSPARDLEKEQNNQEGKEEWAFSGHDNLLSIHYSASPKAEERKQFHLRSCSRGRSSYEAYHAYHTQPPTPPPIPSPPISHVDRLPSRVRAKAWHRNPKPGKANTFSERSIVQGGEKGDSMEGLYY